MRIIAIPQKKVLVISFNMVVELKKFNYFQEKNPFATCQYSFKKQNS